MKRTSIVAGIIALLAMTTLIAGCGGGSGSSKTLTIGVAVDRPGISMKNADGTITGFDADTARFIAKELGVDEDNITWVETPTPQRETMLQNRQVDYIVSAYSITDARKEKVDFAGPYFVAGQSLLVRKDDDTITGPTSLNGNKKLCAPAGSTPAQNIKKKYSRDVQLQQYDTLAACVEALKNGAVDAVTTDDAVLAGYAARSAGQLKLAGAPFSNELYGVGVHKGNDNLREKINDALQKYIDSGAWKASFDRNLGPSGYPAPTPPQIDRYTRSDSAAADSSSRVSSYGGQMVSAFGVTIKLTVFSAILALVLGIVLATLRVSPMATMRKAAGTYVEVVRNTPLTLIILFMSFGLAQTLGITLVSGNSSTSLADSAFRLSVLGLGAYTATFVCEALRSGINTVPHGQAEAARALGMSFTQSMTIVILPQAFRAVIATLGSILIALTKNSTIASVIGVAEAALLMKEMIENTAAVLAVGAMFAIGFLILTIPTGLLFGFLAKRFAIQ